MVEEKSFVLGHDGFVLDMCLDHYGRRLATCSEDGVIKIFRRTNNEQGWEKIAETPRGTSAINRLSWSHPEFSMLLASSSDRSISIWEEEDENKWKLLHSNGEFNHNISSIEFGPKHHGLRLAVATCDGKIQIVSPTDAARKEWIVRHVFNLDQPAPGKENYPCYISWNSFPFDFPSMVVSKGPSAFIWRMDSERKRWRQVAQLSHPENINHVAWAPNMGRSFHMIATAGNDGTARIWSIRGSENTAGDSILGEDKIEVTMMQELKHRTPESPSCEVFRVEWNLTATMLSTSCDDCVVRLWSPNLKGEWIRQVDMDMVDGE